MADNVSALVAQINAGGVAASAPKPQKKAPAKRTTAATTNAKLKATEAARPRVEQAVVSAQAPDPTTAALAKRLKDILDCLYQYNGSELTPAQLRDLTKLDLNSDAALLREVSRHPRITYQGAPAVPPPSSAPAPAAPARWYSYKPEIQGVRDKQGILTYLRDNKGPAVLLDLLKHCYLKAADDLTALKNEGQIYILGHPEAGKETVFVRDMMGQERVKDDVRELWFDVCNETVTDHVPRGLQELQAATVKAGLRSALANQPIKRALSGAPKERARKARQQRFNIEKATNAHLPALFQGAQPKALDG